MIVYALLLLEIVIQEAMNEKYEIASNITVRKKLPSEKLLSELHLHGAMK